MPRRMRALFQLGCALARPSPIYPIDLQQQRFIFERTMRELK